LFRLSSMQSPNIQEKSWFESVIGASHLSPYFNGFRADWL